MLLFIKEKMMSGWMSGYRFSWWRERERENKGHDGMKRRGVMKLMDSRMLESVIILKWTFCSSDYKRIFTVGDLSFLFVSHVYSFRFTLSPNNNEIIVVMIPVDDNDAWVDVTWVSFFLSTLGNERRRKIVRGRVEVEQSGISLMGQERSLLMMMSMTMLPKKRGELEFIKMCLELLLFMMWVDVHEFSISSWHHEFISHIFFLLMMIMKGKWVDVMRNLLLWKK